MLPVAGIAHCPSAPGDVSSVLPLQRHEPLGQNFFADAQNPLSFSAPQADCRQAGVGNHARDGLPRNAQSFGHFFDVE